MVSLPVSQFPAIAPPEVQVQTTYVGADAQTVEQSVATPIEQQMSGVDNMNYMYSVNGSNGDIRRCDRSQHRPDSCAVAAGAGQFAAAGRGHELRRYGAENAHGTADVDQPELANRNLRREVPGELRLHQPQRSIDAR